MPSGPTRPQNGLVGIRTRDLRLARAALYRTELQAQAIEKWEFLPLLGMQFIFRV